MLLKNLNGHVTKKLESVRTLCSISLQSSVTKHYRYNINIWIKAIQACFYKKLLHINYYDSSYVNK